MVHTYQHIMCTVLCILCKHIRIISITEYYAALKGNEVSSHEKTWRKLKYILLSERNQSEKATYCMIPTIYDILEKAKPWEE